MRNDGPAEIHYNRSGTRATEYWYDRGVLHREDGTAEIWFDNQGEPGEQYWYLNGVETNEVDN